MIHIDFKSNNKIGLVLCGGGAKGAFQIGAWAALRKYGLFNEITAVSGTSVGALNAVLFALGDYEFARDIWLSIDMKTLLEPNEDGDALFSRDGLIEIIDALPLSKIRNSRLKVYVTAHSKVKDKVESFCINKLSEKEIKQLLLASSAIPVIYDKVKYKGHTYVDGGVSKLGNTPVEPLYNEGYKDILIISNDNYFNIHHINANKHINIPKFVNLEKLYSDSKLYVVKPQEVNVGAVPETLNFTHTSTVNKIISGYDDTKYCLGLKGGKRGSGIGSLKGADDMKNRYSKVNVAIHDKVKEHFKTADELENFIRMTNIGNINVDTSTLGGQVFYEDIVEVDGWRIQQHKVTGLKSHYRVLDEDNVRRFWIMNPEDFLQALNSYEAARETGIYGKLSRR